MWSLCQEDFTLSSYRSVTFYLSDTWEILKKIAQFGRTSPGWLYPKQVLSQMQGSPCLPKEGPMLSVTVSRYHLQDGGKAGQHVGDAYFGCGP